MLHSACPIRVVGHELGSGHKVSPPTEWILAAGLHLDMVHQNPTMNSSTAWSGVAISLRAGFLVHRVRSPRIILDSSGAKPLLQTVGLLRAQRCFQQSVATPEPCGRRLAEGACGAKQISLCIYRTGAWHKLGRRQSGEWLACYHAALPGSRSRGMNLPFGDAYVGERATTHSR